MELVRDSGPLQLQHIGQLFESYPIRTKLYSIGLLCSPRLCMLWAWWVSRLLASAISPAELPPLSCEQGVVADE